MDLLNLIWIGKPLLYLQRSCMSVLSFCVVVVPNQLLLLFFYMGNEEGFNFYKESEQSAWKHGGDYTIYVRMTMK